MKIKAIAGMSVLAVAASVLVGCATEPVAEYRVERSTYETRPGSTIRYRSVDPVGERIYIDTRGTRTRINDTRFDNRSRYGGWRTEAYAPYGPNSPVSPSQWY